MNYIVHDRQPYQLDETVPVDHHDRLSVAKLLVLNKIKRKKNNKVIHKYKLKSLIIYGVDLDYMPMTIQSSLRKKDKQRNV